MPLYPDSYASSHSYDPVIPAEVLPDAGVTRCPVVPIPLILLLPMISYDSHGPVTSAEMLPGRGALFSPLFCRLDSCDSYGPWFP